MLFNSVAFAVFFLFVYAIYLILIPRHRVQNAFLLASSYFFYGWWDWRFIFLLAAATVKDYCLGLAIARTEDERLRRRYITWSVALNLATLGVFKYFNFFCDNVIAVLGWMHLPISPMAVRVLLPVGVSFFSFHSMAYTIDVYRRKVEATNRLVDYALFVAFFPLLLAGPIERAQNLLAQIAKPRRITVEQVDTGLYLVLWGLFKKVVVADNVALLANQVFNNYTQFRGADLAIGVLAFAIQIYCDFSGYTDMARGCAKLMGFELMLNFRLPYFAQSPSEFWERWHISLSSWLRDYLYIPLGGNRKGPRRTYINLMLTMLLGGLWHGAAWNFVLWGLYHGALLCCYRLFEQRQASSEQPAGRSMLKRLGAWALMLAFTLVGWILFRAHSAEQIAYILTHLGLGRSGSTMHLLLQLLWYAWPLLLMDLYLEWRGDLLAVVRWKPWLRLVPYTFWLYWLFLFGARQSMEFIYFQF